MKKLLIILAVFIFSCESKLEQRNSEPEYRNGGVIEDNPDWVKKVPVITSIVQEERTAMRGKPIRNYDTDGDGIIDKNDACPTLKETFNGYLDGDGCPDTVTVVPPPPPPVETGTILKMPTPIDQGSEGTCVAMAVGYAARSAEQYYKTGATSYSNSVNVFSPEFVYNSASTECNGISMQMGLDVIVSKGVCTFQSMPYSGTNGCALQPNATQLTEAANYKITGYSKIAFTDRTAIKSMIANKHPVIISILADNSFINATTGFIWKVYSGSGMLGHSVTICGYDDTKNAYKIINSWGTDWADGGFSWIDYDFFETGGRTAGAGYVYVIN